MTCPCRKHLIIDLENEIELGGSRTWAEVKAQVILHVCGSEDLEESQRHKKAGKIEASKRVER